jgi:nitrate/nitrite-specific signal transduction histidine kinase
MNPTKFAYLNLHLFKLSFLARLFLLIASLELADAFAGRTGAAIDVLVEDVQAMQSEVRIALYRIRQEAFSDIAKHAKASRAELRLTSTTTTSDVDRTPVHRVELRVGDNDRGFEPTAIQPGHHGLSIICERAGATGADLVIESQTDQGTEIMVTWEERQ